MSIEQLGVLVGIIATITTGGYFAMKEYKRKVLVYRKRFNRTFTNEGEVINPQDPPYLVLRLEVDEDFGTLSGNVESYNQLSLNFDVSGKVKFRSGKITITYCTGRQIHNVGAAKIKLHQRNLKWKLLSGDTEQLPEEALLWELKS